MPDVDVVVLAYGAEPLLRECLEAVQASRGVTVHLTVVDNGCTRDDLDELRAELGGRWLAPGTNTGFTGGCNLGAREGSAPYLVLVNSDAVVEPDALARLVAALGDPAVGIATGLVVLWDDPATVNSAGNPVHWSLLSWAGRWGEAAVDVTAGGDVTSASGALLGIRRATWTAFGGFHEALFAYGEDAELSLRAWIAGQRVVLVPDAVVRHHYEFSRTPGKFFLLERNRLITVLTLPERRTLWSLLPGLLLVEAGITAASVRDGWFAQKRQGWAWIWRHRAQVAERRLIVQRGRRHHDRALLERLADTITPSEESGVAVPGPVNAVLAVQGRLARALARR